MVKKKILVVGAGSYSKIDAKVKGIGTCLVERLTRENNSILFTYYKSKKGAKKLINQVISKHPNLKIACLRFNSLNYKLYWQNLKSKLAKFGTPEVFVHNAGLRFYKQELTMSEKNATMKVNYSCPIFLIEKIGERMYQEGIKGKIVLISSVLAGKNHPFLKYYSLTKGLLEKYAKEHLELWKSKGVEIKVVSPNLTRTPMIEEQIDFYEEEIKKGKRQKIVSPKVIAEEIVSLCL